MSYYTMIPASIQYTVALLTVPLVRAKVISRATASALRTSLRNDLMVLAVANSPNFSLSFGGTSQPSKAFLIACINAGIQWSIWMKHLGGGPLTLVISPSSVVANERTVWRAEKPVLASEAIAILGLFRKVELEHQVVDVKEIRKPVLAVFGDESITFSHTSRIAPTMLGRSPSPFSYSSETSSNEGDTFSDIPDSDDEITGSSTYPQAPVVRSGTQPTTAMKTYRYDQGDTTVLSGGVSLGMPSIACGHPDYIQGGDDDDDQFFDELPRIFGMDIRKVQAKPPGLRVSVLRERLNFSTQSQKHISMAKIPIARSNILRTGEDSRSWRSRI